MSLATEILKYNQNIENSMFRPMPSVVNRPLTEEQQKQFNKFSALGTIPEVNLLSELQLTQLLKENGIILPVGITPSSAEAMVLIQQKLGELSQGRDKTLTLVDLINKQQQSGEKVQNKLGKILNEQKNMNDLLRQEMKPYSEPAFSVAQNFDSLLNQEWEEEKKAPPPPMAVEASPLITSYDELYELKAKDQEQYIRDRGLPNPPSKIRTKKARATWIIQQQNKQQQKQQRKNYETMENL